MGERDERRTVAQVPEEDLQKIVRIIVETARPERVILFGSAARGEFGPNSDLDFLVIKRGDYHHITEAQDIYEKLEDMEYSVDVIVNTPEEVETYRDWYPVVLSPAIREGIVVYERAA